MRAALPTTSNHWRRPSRGQRAKAIALTLAAELIFVLLFLGLAPKLIEQAEPAGEPISFDLAPPAPQAKTPERKAKAADARKATPSKRPPISLPVPKVPLPTSPLVELSKEDLAASDISRLGTAGGSNAGSSAVAMGPGEGPGGARLFKAEWVVEPTDAELAYYMPNGAERGSSADIACMTVENYRVENCRLLSESPMGSGLARAMRLAAWQFKVRPPRVDGKPLIGAWVRIHFDFGKEGK